MRLHTLDVQAFQAFGASERVDFDRLAADGVFLLRGDTGAGKTTLLDAVCFALYGAVPGERQTNARLRSDHARADLPTEVVLEATIREERIRVTRRPEQSRPKLRGEGLTTEKASVRVEAVGADGTARVITTSHDEAREELEGRLLGLTRIQFCQVVLLPQGEFATFLRAKSEDRKVLLTELFAAQRFGAAEDWLTRRSKQAHLAVRDATATVADVGSRLAEATGSEPPEQWREDPDVLVDWLAQRRLLAEAEQATARSARDDAQAQEARAEAALQAVLSLHERRERHAAALAAQGELDRGRAAHDARGRELAAARRAAAVAPLLQEAGRRAHAVADAAARARAALATLGTIDVPLREASAQARRAAGEAAALAAVEDEACVLQRELDTALSTHEQAAAAHAQSVAWIEASGARRELLAGAASNAAEAAVRLPGLEEAAQAAARRAAAASQRDRLGEELQSRRKARDTARAGALDARQQWLELRERRLAGMAAELAGRLAPGEACAVCGALEHPAPATVDAGAAVDAAAERMAQADHERAQRAVDAADAAVGELVSALAAADALAGDAPAAELSKAAQRAAEDLEAAQGLAAGAAEMAAALAAHDQQRERRSAEQAGHAETLARTEQQLEATRAALLARAATLRDALGDARDVATLVARLEARAQALQDAALAAEAADAARTEAQRAHEAAEQAALAAGFASATDAADAARLQSAIDELEHLRRGYDDRSAQCAATLADPALQVAADGPVPDVAAAQAAKREASGRLGDAEVAHELADVLTARLSGLEQTLAKRVAHLAPLREEARRIHQLASLADGSSLQNVKRMRLSAFVLAARLEEIARAATVRLEAMSGGRYALVHSDEASKGARRHGLELRVVDGWTGQERHPSTLSGGETFLASLALALGLADVVSAEAGGARLETLFVDEGFGSLDEEALNEVLDVLDRLRDGGRVVGVVSHVAELQQRITSQLYVMKGRDGSTLRPLASR